MIVQMGLMRKGELIGIENPEVHLHPSLQLQVAEMLIAHAKGPGRRISVVQKNPQRFADTSCYPGDPGRGLRAIRCPDLLC